MPSKKLVEQCKDDQCSNKRSYNRNHYEFMFIL
uniref:Uncharacterized protein n=1 Tax=Arundo donax TaxID=35708 RepID=A0A0A9BFX5_ARUDO